MAQEVPRLSDEGKKTEEPLPLPFHNRSFLAFLATEALGAFNDNVFKQVVLLLSVGYFVQGFDFQSVVMFLFAMPFLLFAGVAGDLADRYSKRNIIVICKWAEIVVMAAGLGVLYFFYKPSTGTAVPHYLWMLAAVTFLMAGHSAFFGPPKYGVIPDLVRKDDLMQANGLVQMTTFLAIVLGVAWAGYLVEKFAGTGQLYYAGLFAVGIAVIGTITSHGVARTPASDPTRRISGRSFIATVPTIVRIAKTDRLLFLAMILNSWFWFVGAVALGAINLYGLSQLGLTHIGTSYLVAILSIGIAAGSLIASWLSGKKVRMGLVKLGLTGMVVMLLALLLVPVYAPSIEQIKHLSDLSSSTEGSIPIASLTVKIFAFSILFLLGVFTGIFSVPLTAFMQARPAKEEKGQVIAALGWLNWVFILAAAPAYALGLLALGSQANYVLAGLGVLTAVVGIGIIRPMFRKLRAEQPEYCG